MASLPALDLRYLSELEPHLWAERLMTTLRFPAGGPAELDVRDDIGHVATLILKPYDGQDAISIFDTFDEPEPIGWPTNPRATARRVRRRLERAA